MSPYETPEGFRRALEARLRERSQSGSDPQTLQRLRRAVVFERIAVRLAASDAGDWIAKGGMALEWRLGMAARATRDLDLVVRIEQRDGASIRTLMIDELAIDADHDRFSFEVGEPTALNEDALGRPVYRFPVTAKIGGRHFESVRLDVSPRPEEVLFRERIRIASMLAFSGIEARPVAVVAPAQQFAEKLHALTRTYGDQPNNRVHDLVDLMLLIEHKLVEPRAAYEASRHVFESRGLHRLPDEVPDPPPSWLEDYPTSASGAGVMATTLPEALGILRTFWSDARAAGREGIHG